MTESKKFFLPALAMAMAGCVSAAQAQSSTPENVLFKIHDVQPVKSTEGVIEACDYDITFYNRSPRALKSASLSLNWQDDSIATVIVEEKNAERKKTGRNYSKTEEVDSASLSTMVDVPSLEPYKQVTIRSRIQTDKCFLMLDNVKFSLRSCNIASEDDAKNTAARRFNNRDENPCDGLFQFVAPTDPEYYREFKPISYEEDRRQGENKRLEERRLINTKYDEVITELNNVSATLEEIRSDGEAATIGADLSSGSQTGKSSELSDAELSAKLKTLFPGLGESNSQPAANGAGGNGSGNGAGGSSSGNSTGGNVPAGGNNASTGGGSSSGNGGQSGSGDNGSSSGAVPSASGGQAGSPAGASGVNNGVSGSGNGDFAAAEEPKTQSKDKGTFKFNSPNVM